MAGPLKIITYATLLSCALIAHGATPKFSIIPSSNPQRAIAPDENININYRVTNNTRLSRILTLVPAVGLSQLTDGSFCSNPFSLASGESCTLRLKVDGSTLPTNGIHSGPEVCKTLLNTNRPDPFLCSQAAPADLLNITRGSSTVIAATPNPLYVSLPASGTVTVQNTGGNPTQNLQLSISPGSVSLLSSCPNTLAPNQSCTAIASSASALDATLTAAADNSNTENVSIHFVNAGGNNTLSIVSPIVSERIIPIDNGGTLAITMINNGPSAATNVALGAVADCPAVTSVGNTCGSSLAVGGTCQITLQSATPYVPCSITITGSNTVPLTAFVAFEKTSYGAFTPNTPIKALIYYVSGSTAYMLTERDPAGAGNALAPWWNGSANSYLGASSLTNGATNTSTILSAWSNSVQDIAAAVCQNQPLDSTWYLPALCQLSGDTTSCVPASENVQTNLFNNGFMPELKNGANGTGLFWTSTEVAVNTAWAQNFKTDSTTGSATDKNSSYGVRCSKTFTF